MINGLGELVTLHKGEEDFYAAGVSMGLFGVIVSVTIKVGERYCVAGYEEVINAEDSYLNSAENLKTSLETQEYVHSVWFPQVGVQ
jgi:hypothetical protein